MPLTDPQKQIFDDPSRFRVCVSGRRFGKTYLSMWEIAKFARYPNKKIFYVAPTYRQAKQIIWDSLKQKLLSRRWVKKINESDLEITLVNNSKIYLRSADKPDSLRGVSMDFLVMDECAMIDQVMWTEVCRPALSDKRGHALFITTPKGMNWIYDLYENAAVLDDWGRYQFTTLEGGQVPDEEVEAARRELDEKSFRQEYMATFETYSGLIYYNWNAERNIVKQPPVIDPRQILHVGMDFNVDPLVAAISVVNNDQITIFDEVVINGSNTFEICEEIQRRYPNNRIYAYPDASGQARKTSSKTTDHMIMRNAGFTLKVKSVNPPVLDRIASVNASLLAADKQTVRLHVTPNCKNVINSLSKQTYKEGTRIPEKGQLDHMSDGVGYLVHWINPLRSERAIPVQPGTFGHF